MRHSALLTTATALTAHSWGQVVGAHSDIRVAVVGLNGRGKNHLSSLGKIKGVRIVAVCDADTAVLERTATNLAKEGVTVKKFTDVRQLLASPDLDAITIATPNHWHSLMGIWALQAGKDIYIEKPVSHNVWEGRQLVAAAQSAVRALIAKGQYPAPLWG
ncbi:MAG: gfo/Idh/MocA family oxidoreductase [Opitutaceae bacterium]|nr:gfo/Idh/MocA family oxidoreductase [Opitutaceae bacterium]